MVDDNIASFASSLCTHNSLCADNFTDEGLFCLVGLQRNVGSGMVWFRLQEVLSMNFGRTGDRIRSRGKCIGSQEQCGKENAGIEPAKSMKTIIIIRASFLTICKICAAMMHVQKDRKRKSKDLHTCLGIVAVEYSPLRSFVMMTRR